MKKTLRIFLIIFIIGIACMIRLFMFPFQNPDLEFYVSWFNYIVAHGGLIALKDPFYSYSPPYLYLLVLATSIKAVLPAFEIIKIISVGFDFIAAWILFRLVKLKYPNGNLPWVGFFAILFAPTVFINSAYWGQCDGIYSAFLLACVYFSCTRRYTFALTCFMSAFSFKAQAVFLAPLIMIFFLKGHLAWRNILLMPVIYLLWLLPSLAVGYPISEALSTYLNQSGTFDNLTMNAPNLYSLIPNRYYDLVVPTGILIDTLIIGLIIWIVIKHKPGLDPQKVIFLSVFFATLLPFIMPKMHERYFYFAALISICLLFYKPKLRLIPLTLQATSLISYTFFLLSAEILPMKFAVAFNGILVCLLISIFLGEFGQEEGLLFKLTKVFQ